MTTRKSVCQSMMCFAKCTAVRLLGVGFVMAGIGMSLTMWLLPIGLPLALLGMGLVRPGEACS